jgi:hypothetical protein
MPRVRSGEPVNLQTRLDIEAMDITKGRTEMPAARLTQVIPSAH